MRRSPRPTSRLRRTPRSLSLLTVGVCLLATACGTQVDDTTRQRAAAAALSGGGTSVVADPALADGVLGAVGQTGPAVPGGAVASTTAAGPATPGGAGAPGTTGGPAAPGGSGAPGTAGGPAAPASAGSTGGTTGSVAAPAPPGGNGGATDVGVTATQILVGNVSDLSGPQPGLFQSAVNGTNAYIAMVNSQGGLFGRKLKISVADSQTSCEGDRSGHAGLVDDVFAFAGSFSLFDSCGASVLKENPSVPDVHNAVTPEANALPNNFSVNPIGSTLNNGVYQWGTGKFGADAVKKTAFLYVNLPAVTNVARLQKKSAASAGWDVVYERAVGATETDFTADILQMKREGIQVFLTLFNSDQMANFKPQADRQDFRPQYLAPLMYDQSFFKKLGGPQAAEGIYGSLSTALYFGKADAAQIPAVAQFQKFYAQVAGGGAADTFAASAWASTHLLVDAMRKAGPKVTRAAVLANLTATKSFDAGGFYAPGNPGDKKAGNCYVIFQIRGGEYQRTDSPAKGFRCDGKQA